MSDLDLMPRVAEIVAAVMNVDAVDRASSPESIATWDSLRHVQMVLAVEETFGIQFAVEDIDGMGTVGAIVDAVQRRLRHG